MFCLTAVILEINRNLYIPCIQVCTHAHAYMRFIPHSTCCDSGEMKLNELFPSGIYRTNFRIALKSSMRRIARVNIGNSWIEQNTSSCDLIFDV